MAGTNGSQELLQRSILDRQNDILRLLLELHRMITILIASYGQRQDQTGDGLRLLERVLSVGPTIWSAILWIWHAIILLIPGVIAGWGMVEGYLALASRYIGAVPH